MVEDRRVQVQPPALDPGDPADPAQVHRAGRPARRVDDPSPSTASIHRCEDGWVTIDLLAGLEGRRVGDLEAGRTDADELGGDVDGRAGRPRVAAAGAEDHDRALVRRVAAGQQDGRVRRVGTVAGAAQHDAAVPDPYGAPDLVPAGRQPQGAPVAVGVRRAAGRSGPAPPGSARCCRRPPGSAWRPPAASAGPVAVAVAREAEVRDPVAPGVDRVPQPAVAVVRHLRRLPLAGPGAGG